MSMADEAPSAGTTALVARTVLDLRPGTGKYVRQTMLLAASWHRHARSDAGLEVLTIGTAGMALADFLQTLGVRHVRIAPGANDDFSRNGNKIEGACPDAAGRRVLLLDNDTCFLGGLADLGQIPATAIAAAQAGNARVDDKQWELVRDGIGLPLLRRTWAPLNVPGGEDASARRERWLYLNSGVILFSAGHDHREAWQSSQRAIHDYFRDHPLASAAVMASDQAGFATSVAMHGGFAWLPLRFNYRPPCFGLGLEAAGDIRVLHFTNDIDDEIGAGIAGHLDAYWNRRILARIDRLPASVPAMERERRRIQALEALWLVEALVKEYDLERWWQVLSGSLRVEGATA